MTREEAIRIIRTRVNDALRIPTHGCCRHFYDELAYYRDPVEVEKKSHANFQIYKYTNAFYWGELQNGKPHNLGYMIRNDGSFYVGDFRNGMYDGDGIYVWNNRSFYIGEWENDKFHGHGCHRGSNGIETECDYRYDERIKVYSSSDDFIDTETGKEYTRENNYSGGSKGGCAGIIVIIIIAIILFNCC